MKFPDIIKDGDVAMLLNEMQIVGFKVSKVLIKGRKFGVVIKEYVDDGKRKDQYGSPYRVRAVYEWDDDGHLIRH